MDVGLVSGLVGAQAAQVQTAIAAKILKMNADAQAAVAKLLESAQQEIRSLANVAAGVGNNLDISV